MLKTTKIILVLLAVLLCGCGNHLEYQEKSICGSRYWAEYPGVEPGKMESDALEVTTWDAGRLEATSYETMAETKQGYYLVYRNQLYYADKENLNNWVLVCKDPDCGHRLGTSCSANVMGERIVVKDNRLFTLVDSGTYPEIYDGKTGVAVMSVAPDGTDRKLEYVLREGEFSGDAGIAVLLYSDQILYNAQVLLPDGMSSAYLFRATDAGVETVKVVEDFNKTLIVSTPTNIVYGVRLFGTTILDDTGKMFYYYRGNTLDSLDVTTLPGTGGYLSGETLRYFSREDGYYDYDMETGKSVFLGKARLQNSRARVLLPNCILETTLIGSNSTKENINVEAHEMVLFDGVKWRKVSLPEELRIPEENLYISVMGVSSDSIFIACYDARNYTAQYGFPFSLYIISLEDQEPEMAYCGTIACRGL